MALMLHRLQKEFSFLIQISKLPQIKINLSEMQHEVLFSEKFNKIKLMFFLNEVYFSELIGRCWFWFNHKLA